MMALSVILLNQLNNLGGQQGMAPRFGPGRVGNQ
jgi:hypothetical protein